MESSPAQSVLSPVGLVPDKVTRDRHKLHMQFIWEGPLLMETNQLRLAVYTGTFDPITLGHLNVIKRAARLVDKLIVGVGINIDKRPLFTAEERMSMIERVTSNSHNIEVRAFEGLAVEFVRECNATIMIRGIRPLTDVAAEFTMLLANRQLAGDVETIFLMADKELAHVSSSLIKEITSVSTDAMLARFVPAEIIPAIRTKIPGPPQSEQGLLEPSRREVADE